MHRTCFLFFFFNDTATTEIYTLSLHDALPICVADHTIMEQPFVTGSGRLPKVIGVLEIHIHFAEMHGRSWCLGGKTQRRSEEHTSELQSQSNLVCRLLLEKKKY